LAGVLAWPCLPVDEALRRSGIRKFHTEDDFIPRSFIMTFQRAQIAKLAFISRFTHHLCFENEIWPGYLTEKLFDALFVEAVPLYCGDPHAHEWFHSEAYIDCTNLAAEAIASKVSESFTLAQTKRPPCEEFCHVPFEEMEVRSREFQSRVIKDRCASN
jgi:hypothetical protein